MATKPFVVLATSPNCVSSAKVLQVQSLLVTCVTNEKVRLCWPHEGLLEHTTSDWPPAGLCATDHHLLGLAVQPVSNPPHHSLI